MAATIEEQHDDSRGFYARVRFTAQGDSVVLRVPNPRRQLAAHARIVSGTLSAYTSTVTTALNPAVDPATTGCSVTDAAPFALAAAENPYMAVKVATSLWTGTGVLEVVIGGTY